MSDQLLRLCAVSILLSVCNSASGQDDKLQISGYGNLHYMEHSGLAKLDAAPDPNGGTFQMREFTLFMDFQISDDLVASTELEAGNNGNEYSANYAYVAYSPTDRMTFRVGKVLVPFLSYNENKPNYLQALMSQPFTAWQVAPVNGSPLQAHGFGWSDAGIVLDWGTPIADSGAIGVKASIINGIGSNDAVLDGNTITLDDGSTIRGRDGLIDNEGGDALGDNNGEVAMTLKVSYASFERPLDFGLSLYQGAWDIEGDYDLGMYGFHLNYLEEDWTVRAEWVQANVEQQAGINFPGGPAINVSTGDYSMNAWYLEGSYILRRFDDERWLRAIVRLDDVDTNDEAAFTPFDRGRTTLGLEYQYSSNARLRAEFQRHTIDDFQNAPQSYLDAGGDEDINVVMFSMIFWF
jgi:hypothetical protein